MKKKLLYKVLGIIALTLCIGFAGMGLSALWLQFRSTMELQVENSRTLAAVIVRDIDEYLMKGETKEAERYVEEITGKRLAVNLLVFNKEAKAKGRPSAIHQELAEKALKAGGKEELREKIDGRRVLTVVVPLKNEERCKGCHQGDPATIGVLVLSSSLDKGYASAVNLSMVLTLAGIISFATMLIALYLFFRQTIIREIGDFSENVLLLAEGEGDLTREIAVRSEDEIGKLAGDINRLTGKLREIIGRLYDEGGRVAIKVCHMRVSTEKTVDLSGKQKEEASAVAVAAEEMAATLNSVAANTHQAASLADEVSRAAGEGMSAVQETWRCMEGIRGSVEQTMETVQRLAQSSASIGEIVGLIEEIADQTNLLALNAAIEAARAGEHGRGFAVVADEVKNLSAKTAASTQEIAKIIAVIQQEGEAASTSMSEEQARVVEGVATARSARDALDRIAQLIDESSAMIGQIATASEEQSATTNEITQNIQRISTVAQEVNELMTVNDKTLHQLGEVAEQIYETVGRFRVGNYHDSMKGYACELRDKVESALQKAVNEGKITVEALFSRQYRPIPNTSPQKYGTAFDALFDRLISPLQEEVLGQCGDMVFAICIDDHGYCPSHNLKFSKPLTGDPEVDKVQNRTKRIFDDRTGLRAAKNTTSFLLQTYMRDTGEIMNDLSTPLTIAGRHWGGIRIGYHAAE